jgi:RimJ/RimL family protein N-acetyltransferase
LVPLEWIRGEIAASGERFARLGAGLWTIQFPDDTRVIGFVGFRDFFDPPRLQLLVGLLPAHWRRGVAREAAEGVCDHAFSEPGFSRIEAATDVPNRRSIALLERLGMSRLDRSDEGHHGMVSYEIDRESWVTR